MSEYEARILDKFLDSRCKLIKNLEEGIFDKKEFLFQNYLLITNLQIKPFNQPNTIEKCIYNYQYFNILAKYNKVYPLKGKDKDSKSLVDYYYQQKDWTIETLLDIENLGRVDAYPIFLQSKRLNKKLIEINFLDFKYIVLHSMNEKIKVKLIDLEYFDKVPRESVISSYVNKAY